MALPTMTGVGRLIEDPELRYTSSAVAMCKVRIAFNSRRKNEAGEWIDGDKFYANGTVWEEEAQNVAESLRKGDLVTVTGRLKTESWTDREGSKRTSTALMIDSIGPSMKYATVKVNKLDRKTGVEEGDPYAVGNDQEPPF
jgi:single-strand DNA-binding protein